MHSLQTFKETAEVTLGLGAILTACEGLGIHQKVRRGGRDSFNEGQRKVIRNYIAVNFVLIVCGKKME